MSARSEPVLLAQGFAGRRVGAVVSPVGASLQGLAVNGLELVCCDVRSSVAVVNRGSAAALDSSTDLHRLPPSSRWVST